MPVTCLRRFLRACPVIGVPVCLFLLMAAWLLKRKYYCVLLLVGSMMLFIQRQREALYSVRSDAQTSMTYTLKELSPLPNAVASGAEGINDATQVVGWAGKQSDSGHAVLWSGEEVIDLHSGQYKYSEAKSINNQQGIVGWVGNDRYASTRAFLWQSGTMRDLGTIDKCKYAEANSINDKGQIVGVSYNSKEGARVDESAFLWQRDKMISLRPLLDEDDCDAASINAKGQIVGYRRWMRDYLAFSLHNKQHLELAGLGGVWRWATSVNKAGQIVGASDVKPDSGYINHACLWQKNSVVDLGTLGGGKSEARSINSHCQVVGWSYIADDNRHILHAFLWERGKMVDLNTLLPKNSGWTLEQANGLNDKGQIVGIGQHKGQTRAFLLTPTNR